MGVLTLDGGELLQLWSDHLIGRTPDAALRIDDPSISWRHAGLRWTGRLWELQDLGSMNGTFLDGQRLDPGNRFPLRLGAQLRFGEWPRVLALVDADPPSPSVVALDTGERYLMQGGMIDIPDPDAPLLTLYQHTDGRWLAEDGAGVREARGHELLAAGGRRFRFEPGVIAHATASERGTLLCPDNLAIEFRVSRNEEHVDITVVGGTHRLPLRPRAHSYLLLTLARIRLQDQLDPSQPAAGQGWVDQERLLKMLATTPAQLALDIHRARRQFRDAGVADAAHLIERRPDSRELRIGVARLAVVVT